MANKRGRKSMLATKTQGILEMLREQARVGCSPSWFEMRIEYNLSQESLSRILQALEFDGRIIRRCGRGNVRNEYIIQEERNES